MRLGRKLETAREILRSEGFGSLVRHAAARVSATLRSRQHTPEAEWEQRKVAVDAEFDRALGVDTGGTTELDKLHVIGPNRRFANRHIASDPEEFAAAVGELEITHRDFTFVDLGSGKGRAVMLALGYPFRRVIGVEFALPLHQTAQANLAALSATGVDTSRIELLHGDVTEYAFPSEPLVLFLYNPFEGPVMKRLVERVRDDHSKNPRPMHIVYVNPFLESVWTEGGFDRVSRGTTQSILMPK